jgi:hypothetical protein
MKGYEESRRSSFVCSCHWQSFATLRNPFQPLTQSPPTSSQGHVVPFEAFRGLPSPCNLPA